LSPIKKLPKSFVIGGVVGANIRLQKLMASLPYPPVRIAENAQDAIGITTVRSAQQALGFPTILQCRAQAIFCHPNIPGERIVGGIIERDAIGMDRSVPGSVLAETEEDVVVEKVPGGRVGQVAGFTEQVTQMVQELHLFVQRERKTIAGLAGGQEHRRGKTTSEG
jgi:hypothetical protein